MIQKIDDVIHDIEIQILEAQGYHDEDDNDEEHKAYCRGAKNAFKLALSYIHELKDNGGK